MSPRGAQAGRPERARARQQRAARARVAAVGSLLAVLVLLGVIVVGSGSGSSSHSPATSVAQANTSGSHHTTPSADAPKPGTANVPILRYHIINVVPSQSGASPDLYVPTDEFSAQMAALKAAGWSAVTLNQLQAYWAGGKALPPGKPLVITFDGGYASQYTNALPVLKRLGWAAVEDIQVSGPSTADGGLTDTQIRALIAAGWELDAEGSNEIDFAGLSSTALGQEILSERQTLRGRYAVPVNWFSYPSGRYSADVTAAVRAAGFTGATTTEPGWASAQADRFRLPRLSVVGGTSATALISQISSAQSNPAPPVASTGT